MVGVPVIINHKDITKKNADNERVGVVNSVWYDEKDGWYWCDGIIWDETAQNLITDKNWSVSCSYDVKTADNKGGSENNIKYDMEFLDGVFTHLALVNNPRYERANIVFNSKTEVLNDKWITIKPHGDDSDDYRRLKLEDGETPKEAIERAYGKDDKKEEKEDLETVRKEYAEIKKSEPGEEEVLKQIEEHAQKKREERKSLLHETFDKEFFDKYNPEGKELPKDFVERYSEKKDSYYEPDMEETYTKSYEENIQKDFEEFMKAKKEPEKSDLDIKREAYESTLKKLHDAEARKWKPKDDADWYAAVKEGSEAKKALTDLRRDYAESIMANFEESDDTSYEDKLEARRERYEGLAEKANKESNRYAQISRDMISAIPMGQPIHGQRDANYRQKAWDKMGKSYELSKKSDYFEGKAESVGKGGISADDKNAIKKLSDKYNNIKKQHERMKDANKIVKSKADEQEKIAKLIESGWTDQQAQEILAPDFVGRVGFPDYQLTSNTAEMRRIIDRVIDIHSRAQKVAESPKSEDYSDYGFEVERNTDINRLQLKFPGKPDASVRDVLKSNGFRWSPREGAWQRQLTGNAEYSLKRVVEKLKANNSKEQDMALLEELKKLITKVENDKGEDMDDKEKIENEKVDKREIIREIMAIAGKHEDNEDVRTIAKLAEKLGYDESEAGSADNKKAKNEKEDEKEDDAENCKVKNEDLEDKDKVADLKEDEKKDVENKCRNAKEETKDGYFEKMNEIYNASKDFEVPVEYVSRDAKIKAAEEYFS